MSERARSRGSAAVGLIELPLIADTRGTLTFCEVGAQLPFVPKRMFYVSHVPSNAIRGEHAHRTLHELLVCVGGSVCVTVDDGCARETFVLDRPNLAVYLPPMTWASLHGYSPGAILVVLASDVYDAGDYIRSYEQFRSEVSAR